MAFLGEGKVTVGEIKCDTGYTDSFWCKYIHKCTYLQRTNFFVTDEIKPLKESLKETKATWNLIYKLDKKKKKRKNVHLVELSHINRKAKFRNP